MGYPSPAEPPRTLRLGTRAWNHGSFGIMAVVNRTPDSFFDRGTTIGFGAALSKRLLKHVSDRVEGCVLKIRCARALVPSMRSARQPLANRF